MMRRVPAERARHAKRLGQAGPGGVLVDSPTTGTTTQETTPTSVASPTPTTTTSTTPSSSSAPPTSSTATTTHATSLSSSVTTSPTSTSSSVVPSGTTQASASTPPSLSSSPITVTQPPTSTPTYSTSSSTSTPQANATSATSSGLSGAALAGIIAGAVIVGVALIVFFVRKTYLRRRERKRISWNEAAGLGAGIPEEPKFPDISGGLDSPQRRAPSPFEAHGQSMYPAPVPPAVRMPPSAIATYITPSPPPATYNNPIPIAPYPTQPVPGTYGPGALTMGRMPSLSAQQAPGEAMVKCTFVPTLPDELSITTGEHVFIIEEYDDGWNLCANGRGERGMVPRECLERAPSEQPGVGWGNVRRLSSLNPDANRF